MSQFGNLLEALCPGDAAVEDVLLVMDSYFPSVRGEKDSTVYSRDKNSRDLLVQYKDGKVVAILAGESLDTVTLEQLSQRIQAEVVESPGVRIARRYLFSKLPVTGCWRYEDQFQILPIPEEAPKPPSIIAPQPFLLEFKVHRSTNALIELHRRHREIQRLVNLLNALCNCRIWTTSPKLQFRWVAVEGSDHTIQCVSEAYAVAGEPAEQGQWTQLDSFPALERVSPDDEYYSPMRRIGHTLCLPTDAAEYVRAVSKLSGDRLYRFRRATYWLGYAEEASFISDSAAYVALATALECLLPTPDRGITCDKCGRSIGPGPTANFKAFLDTYLPSTAKLRSTKKSLYSLRSTLAHGWDVFQADLDLFSYMHPDRFSQWFSSLDMEKAIRWVIHNWLLEYAR